MAASTVSGVESVEASGGGVRVRPQRPGELAAVLAVVGEAFGRPVVAELVTRLQGSPAGQAGISLVADLDGDIVGHVQFSRCWVDAPEELVEVLSLSPLAVQPRHQGRGIGSHLVREALQAAQDAQWPLVFLEGSPTYYRRFGFEAAHTRGFTSPSTRIPEEAFQVAVLPGWDVSMTGAFVYADIFWELDCVGLRTQS
jgi:putative acetyltransferase